jgi:uncharacterized protein (DUF1330 family)
LTADVAAQLRAHVTLQPDGKAVLHTAAMTVYAVAQIAIHDRERYERYVAGFMPVLLRYGGRLLAADEHPTVREGVWPYEKIIVMAFSDRSAFERWAGSPEYREISRDRHAATTGVVLLVHGVPTRDPNSATT